MFYIIKLIYICFNNKDKLVWFDPGLGYYIPGTIAEENHVNKSVLIRANYIGKVCTYL